MILETYLDESGVGSNDDALVVAGHMSQSEKWEHLARAWSKHLEAWGLEYFHMADFERRQGPYRNWNEDSRRERLNRLLDLILEDVVASVAIAVPTDRFNRVFEEHATRNLKYAVAGRALFWEISKVSREGEPLPVYDINADRFAFIYEAGARGSGHIERVFNRYYNNPLQRMVFRLVTFSFSAKKEHIPLQAADILAYEMYRAWSRETTDPSLPTRYPLQRLRALPHSFKAVSETDMTM